MGDGSKFTEIGSAAGAMVASAALTNTAWPGTGTAGLTSDHNSSYVPGPLNIPAAQMRQYLRDVGFNQASVDMLMEVNPRLIGIAIEAKYKYDNDPANQIKDKQGHVIGHKTFQVQPNGGFRTVHDQKIASGAGNSNANANKFQSYHQHGEAFDFWAYDHYNGPPEREVRSPAKTQAQLDEFTRIAQTCLQTEGARKLGLTEDDSRIDLNGSPDWGHFQMPKRYWSEWERNPVTGLVYLNGQQQPGTWIDPKLHHSAGATYAPPQPKAHSHHPHHGR